MFNKKVSLYVPLLYLQYGQLGIKGHVYCFPQDVQQVCTVLPCLSKQVTIVKVVQRFKKAGTSSNGDDDFSAKI